MTESNLPSSPEAEKAVLGCMLIDPDCAREMAGRLSPGDFCLPENRAVFEAVRAAASRDRTADEVAVFEEMRKSGAPDGSIRDRLMGLIEITPTSANAAEYAAILREKAELRAAGATG